MVNTGRLALSWSGKAWGSFWKGLAVEKPDGTTGLDSWTSHIPPLQQRTRSSNRRTAPLPVQTSGPIFITQALPVRKNTEDISAEEPLKNPKSS